jgi:N-formylglutamate amidohydrolase
MDRSAIVIHVPHASTFIPDAERGAFQCDLEDELLKMTDHYCNELFCGDCPAVVFPVSRLVCDPERFRDDTQESMSAVGMGAVYTRTHNGALLRIVDDGSRERILRTYYDPHHKALTNAVQTTLDRNGRCLIIDGHSFPAKPLPYEHDQNPYRPDFCIGTDPHHTPDDLIETAVRFLETRGYTTMINAPFSGTLVPMMFYTRDKRVSSIMIEINRGLYMYDDGTRNKRFSVIKADVQALLTLFSEIPS